MRLQAVPHAGRVHHAPGAAWPAYVTGRELPRPAAQFKSLVEPPTALARRRGHIRRPRGWAAIAITRETCHAQSSAGRMEFRDRSGTVDRPRDCCRSDAATTSRAARTPHRLAAPGGCTPTASRSRGGARGDRAPNLLSSFRCWAGRVSASGWSFGASAQDDHSCHRCVRWPDPTFPGVGASDAS
jgi:hypothetical protein